MINKKVKNLFTLSIISSICLVAGIFFIIFGAVFARQNLIFKFMLIVGIVFVVINFYATPLFWVNYTELKKYQNICLKITQDNINKISILSTTLGYTTNETLKVITYCMQKNYLKGYCIIKNEYIEKTENEKILDILNGNIAKIKCNNCGATLSAIGEKKIVCPYCGTTNFID